MASSSPGNSKDFESSSKSEEPAADGPPKDNVYERWYKKLSKFYQRLPTVYNEDTSTPSLPFNNLATVERRCFGAKRRKDIGEFLNATIHGIDGYVEEAKKIDYKEILHSKEVTTGKKGIISGAPGCGKTTLSRKVCQDLYSQVLPNKYKMILLVELRKLKTALKEMKEDIDLQFLLRGVGVSNLPQLCETMEKSDGEGVAMILDGFDEVADYLGKSPFLQNLLSVEEPYLSECDVFVTTRPSRCPELMSLMRKPSRHVETLGFTDSDIDVYVQNFFREANSDKSEAEAKSKVVIDKLNSLPIIRGMSRIPLVLKIICKVQDHLGSAPLPETVSGIFSLYICHQLVEYLVWASQCTGAPISDVLKIPTDLFPGFYPLCEIAYKCCSDKKGQRLILTEEDVKEVKEHIDKCGSIYNLLFSERVDETSPIAGIVYQFYHKTVQETLAAIHIAHQREEDQQRIWSEIFARPEMGEVWKVYCGLTGLRFVDLSALSQSSLSQRARDAGVYMEDDDKLVTVSLFEGGNRSLSVRILPTLIGKNLIFSLESPYDVHVLQSTLRDHPSLEELDLTGGASHPVGVESLASAISQHQSLRKLTLRSFHQSDFEEFGGIFKICHNLKSIALHDAPVDTVLAVVASGIEELQLVFDSKEVEYNHEDWRALQHALDASRSLMSFHINALSKMHRSSPFIEHLALNKTLVNLNIVSLYCDSEYFELPLSCLRSLLGPREKCHVRMTLTRQQWCAVLSGLKEAKALKELTVHMELPHDSSHACEGDHSQILSTCELEELVATSERLVKVYFICFEKKLSDLMLAIVKGVARNQNVSQLGIAAGDSRSTFPSLGETLAHAHHISHLTWRSSHVVVKTLAHSHHVSCWEFRSQSLAKVLGPNWCQLVIDGLMCRRVCHLELKLSVAEWGEFLSRVHQAEQLEEFSLGIEVRKSYFINIDGNEDIDDDVVRRVEDVWSKCTLKKVELSTEVNHGHTAYWHLPPPWYKLLGAVLRGVAVNRNNINFVLKGESHHFSKDDLVSQLGQEKVKRFEVVEGVRNVYFISHPLDSTCSSGSDGRPLEGTQSKDGGLLQSTMDNKKRAPDPASSEMPSPKVRAVNLPSPQGPPGSTEVVQGPVTSEMPSPEVDPVNPPSPQGPPAESTDETSSTSLWKPKEDISSKHQLSVYDQIPSDVGLLAVWEEIPKWEIPIYLGVPVVQVQSLEHERLGGVKALCYWRDGKCMGFPPTWNSLLNAVECSEGPLIREELAAKVSTEKIWTQSVPGPVSSEMPSPEVGPVNPPSPQGPPGSTEVVQGPVSSEMPSPEVGPVNPPSPQGPPDEEFDSEAFMNRFSERFLESVDSHAIVTRLEIDYIISKDLAYTINHSSVDRGNEVLFLHLRSYAGVNNIGKLCDVMISKDGYHSMQKLGQDMKEDLAKFTGETGH